MDEKHRKILQIHHTYLVDNMNIEGKVLDYLREKSILSSSDLEKLKAIITTKDKIQYLIVDILPRRGPDAYPFFIEALNFDGQQHIAEKLEESIEAFRSCNKIHFGSTKIRIKHKETGRYLTIVERERWPAATLGLSTDYHFILNGCGDSGITIKTLNSMHAGYDLLSAWQEGNRGGWVFGDVVKGDKRSHWFTSKEPPLCDGDVVTLMNKRYSHDTYLCRNQGSTTDVYTCDGQADEWILEVV